MLGFNAYSKKERRKQSGGGLKGQGSGEMTRRPVYWSMGELHLNQEWQWGKDRSR